MLNLNAVIPPYLLNLDGPTPCYGRTDLFVGESSAPGQAKALCAVCPVMEACGQWAIDNKEYAGIWGGMTPKERRPSRSTTPEDCGTESAYRRHCALGEECEHCWEQQAVRIRADRERRLDIEHASPARGSRSGYYLERVLGLPYCPYCRGAVAAASVKHKARRRRAALAGAPPVPGAVPLALHGPVQTPPAQGVAA